MGLSISTASPIADGVTLENFNGAWRVIPGIPISKIMKEVYSYSLPSALASASIFAITNLPARPTLNSTKKYKVYLKITNGTSRTLLDLGIFDSGDVTFTGASIPYSMISNGILFDVDFTLTDSYTLTAIAGTELAICGNCLKSQFFEVEIDEITNKEISRKEI